MTETVESVPRQRFRRLLELRERAARAEQRALELEGAIRDHRERNRGKPRVADDRLYAHIPDPPEEDTDED